MLRNINVGSVTPKTYLMIFTLGLFAKGKSN